jgi:hypothetical protein
VWLNGRTDLAASAARLSGDLVNLSVRTWPVLALGVAVLVVAALLVLPGPVASAATGCPDGFRKAFADKTVVGEPVRTEAGQDFSETVRRGELKGWGCVKRLSGSKLRVVFRWKAVGKIQGGSSLVVQLRDCTTGRYDWTRYWNFENGPSAGRTGERAWTATLAEPHRFKVRITGYGKYDRSRIANGSALLGHYYPPSAQPPAWAGSSTCA